MNTQPFSQTGQMIELLWVLTYTMHMTICSHRVTIAFQSESTLYNCLNVKKLLARNRRDIWSLYDHNGTQTDNHLVRKWTLSYIAKLAKLLSCVVSTYLSRALDCCSYRVTYFLIMLRSGQFGKMIESSFTN